MDIVLRKWNRGDAPALSLLLDGIDRRYLSDRLPRPYTLTDGEQWLDMVLKQEGKAGIFRAVMVDGELAGSISVEQKSDVYRRDAEIGYLLAGGYWSKGIMTEAVRQMCAIAFRELDIIRITGLVYEPNAASRRVLEKNGFTLEGLMRNAITKDGDIYNLYIYGKLI